MDIAEESVKNYIDRAKNLVDELLKDGQPPELYVDLGRNIILIAFMLMLKDEK